MEMSLKQQIEIKKIVIVNNRHLLERNFELKRLKDFFFKVMQTDKSLENQSSIIEVHDHCDYTNIINMYGF